MEAKDVALLGFVSSAKDYINRHINDGTNLDKLNKFDINTLDSELSRQLKYFNGDQETINSLLQVGTNAFGDFAKEQIENKANILFDTLGEVFEVKEIKTKQEEPVIVKTKEDVIENVQEENIQENVQEENINTPDEFGLTPDDEYLKAIEKAASKSNEELERFNKKVPQDEKMDDVYKDVVEEETKNEFQPLSSVLKSLAHQDSVIQEHEKKEEIVEHEYSSLSESLKGISRGYEPVFYKGEKEEKTEEYKPTTVSYIENPALDIIEPNNAIDVKEYEEENQEVIENPASTFDSNINSSLAALQDFVNNKEVDKQEELDMDEELYESIAKAYPYLNMKFIKSAYKLKDSISDGFEFGEKIVILHRISFVELENLHEFVEIIMEHNYSVNVDEKKMIVDAFKEFDNEDGLILANIYSMANQARVLNGEYEGYRVLKEEEE